MKSKKGLNQIPKLHLACSKDTLTPAMCCVYISNGIATATNAHIMIQMHLKEESTLTDEDVKLLNGKMIHYSMWSQMVNADLLKVEEDGVLLTKGALKYKVYFDNLAIKPLPFDTIKKDLIEKGISDINQICLNANLMKIAQDVLKSDNLKINFYGEGKKGIIAYQYKSRKAYAIIMPCMVEKETYDLSIF